jgi:Family of unknown function (DUF5565)
MEKIISLFQRNYETDRLVRDEIVPGAEWVVNGEGVATRKIDGTACMVRSGVLYKRYDAKKGKVPPEGFEPAQPEPDAKTGHWPGWLRVGEGPEDRWFREAYDASLADGTYELLGPKVQGNPEKKEKHVLVRHGSEVLEDAPCDYESIKEYLRTHDIEGIVWWRDLNGPNCAKVKIKAKDFGLKRGEGVSAQ